MIDDSLPEGITMMWKVDIDVLLFDRIILFHDDHLRLRSKMCATLGLM